MRNFILTSIFCGSVAFAAPQVITTHDLNLCTTAPKKLEALSGKAVTIQGKLLQLGKGNAKDGYRYALKPSEKKCCSGTHSGAKAPVIHVHSKTALTALPKETATLTGKLSHKESNEGKRRVLFVIEDAAIAKSVE